MVIATTIQTAATVGVTLPIVVVDYGMIAIAIVVGVVEENLEFKRNTHRIHTLEKYTYYNTSISGCFCTFSAGRDSVYPVRELTILKLELFPMEPLGGIPAAPLLLDTAVMVVAVG